MSFTAFHSIIYTMRLFFAVDVLDLFGMLTVLENLSYFTKFLLLCYCTIFPCNSPILDFVMLKLLNK